MLVVWGRKPSAFHLLSGNRSTNQPNYLSHTLPSKDPQTLHVQDSMTPAIQWTEEVESLTCRDPFSALLPHCWTREAVSVQHCLLQCRGSQRVGCRTGMAGTGNAIQLHILLLPGIPCVSSCSVAVGAEWCLWAGVQQEKKDTCNQPILWVNFRQFILFVPSVNNLVRGLNDLLRGIQILKEIYHLCFIRGIGRRIPSVTVSVPLRKPASLEKDPMACWSLC